MWKTCRLPLLILGLATISMAAPADDAALAAKLVGAWEGRWEFDTMGGRLSVKITASSGHSLKGETTWFGTAVGDFSDRFSSTRWKGGKLKVSEQTMDFEVTVSEDGNSMKAPGLLPWPVAR